ncbi:MAG TPA: class I SAM-dependent methyltransferase [Acidimicrobiales bacterium]|nr:class I SAM-dependent methyltransferase [Acidimicrobiales bacterium]
MTPIRPIHEAAAKGFERGAADYEKGRPGYPATAIDVLVRECGIDERTRVVDIGAGTGKFTAFVLDHTADIVAVEPVAAMRAAFSARFPDIPVIDGTAEDLGLPDHSADVATVAQAFHWFDHGVALDEISRVVRPGGWLALIWNTRDLDVPWLAQINDVMEGLAGDAPRFRSDDETWHASIDDHPAFGPLGSAVFDNAVGGMDLEAMRARVASTSYVSALPDAEREVVLQSVERIVRAGPMADEGPVFTERYRTELFWCRRT